MKCLWGFRWLFFLFLAQCKRLEGGLDKLKEASEQLAELNVKLADQKLVLAEKTTACEALLENIATNTNVGQWVAASFIKALVLCNMQLFHTNP